ncbi:Protein of unknown function [Cnuella takakiae]|uniref:DUF3347 domain-containing protein n=2 Tax=Cnuella takakiae TaxID=1302690 RepID=A0A1M4SKJ4_9BACT|nr:DUF3347 domain-containing protein [Cnuella takakiae]OLY95050.1 hypothetical protein BUE76_23655 [Cnuella takakiae]SHE32726.1 Protein of unknown function [Cnuella takakiae]
MQKFHHYIIPLTVAFMLASCGGSQKKETKRATGTNTIDHAVHAPGAVSLAPLQRFRIKDDGLNAVYQQYQQLTSALTNGKLAEAKIASNALEAGAAEVQGGKGLASAAARIVEAPSIEKQRAHFASLSDAMIGLVKKAGVEGELYMDYCPMALDNKGAYWLSTDKEIRNPYFGEEMLTCGEVKETIK